MKYTQSRPPQLLPRKRAVAAARPVLVADDGDRALAGVVDVRDAAALRLGHPRDVEPQPLRLELVARAPAELVVAERGEERRLAAEVRELNRGDGSAAGRLRPRLGRVDDLARPRHRLDADEVDPFDVPDDCGSHDSHSRASGG